ncbi:MULTISPECIES: hypothetical protein [Pseudomonas]|uniref:Uncharacterized protein n=1 Tax=Pseudomonas graminis TaxID=158627 RepID=A0A1C2DRC2_9PSED|nr:MULTISPECIES: hypothetical protein [Pseudomonas]MBD8597805.1 hypothetical protein [Pseudomonas sp. CFBP 8772]OCX17297.1 hypothetical protein BBI10_17405 [Pseudomonas graminis]
MAWNRSDNKKYRGKIDRIFVSLTESWEVEYFIDHYLKTRGKDISDSNRDLLAAKLEDAPGHAPHKRDELNTWLDGQYGVKTK